MKRLATATSIAVLLFLSAAGAGGADTQLRQLRSLDDLVTAFNQDQGVPRVVLLLSPT